MRVLIRWTFLTVVIAAGLAPLAAAHAQSVNSHGTRTGASSVPATRDRRVFRTQSKSTPAPVTLSVAVGYSEMFRTSAWVPVRITARNQTASTITGMVEVPDASSSGGFQGLPQPYRSLYQTPLVLAGGVTKEVTLFIPGSSVGGSVDVRFRVSDRVYASAADSPSALDQSSLSIGALSSDPANITWLKHINTGTGTAVSVVRLTPGILDALPAALANFDLIAIVDGSVSGLDGDQLSALDQYVRNGGSLILVGGPGWQESLRPLPPALIPGTLAGTTTLPDLTGLVQIQKVALPRQEASTAVSVLHDPQGAVLAAERGLPLAVLDPVGSGQVLYLAFDPTLDPVAHWSGARSVLSRLILRAAPSAAGRPARAQSGPESTLFVNPFAGPSNIGAELGNVRGAALPSIVLFLILAALYILLLGPANVFILHWLRRPGLLWVTVPLGSLLCLGATLGVAGRFRGSVVMVNTIGMVTLNGPGVMRPAALYMGLFAPVPGDYDLTFDGRALPQYVPQFNYGSASPDRVRLGLRLQEGSSTDIRFLGMGMWSMRDVALHTTVNIPGRVSDTLHIDRRGEIIGMVRNDTRLSLVHPIIVAGRGTVRLPDMPPGTMVTVRVKPYLHTYDTDFQPLWNQVYGQPQFGGPVYFGGGWYFTSGPCCYGPSTPAEHTFEDRIRDAATQIPDAQNITSLGEVLFVAWTLQPLGSIHVDGAAPQRRDLTMVVSPLSVDFGSGRFVLRTGTFGARLVDISPRPGTSGCCGEVGANSIDVATGGSATFEFDLPAAGRIRFDHLRLSVDAGGANGMGLGRLWDWRAGRWTLLDLSLGYADLHDPNRFISSHGVLLVKLVNSRGSALYQGPGDLRILDVHRNLQISGDGVVA